MIATEKLWLLAVEGLDQPRRLAADSGSPEAAATATGGTVQSEDKMQVAGLVIVWLLILGGMLLAG